MKMRERYVSAYLSIFMSITLTLVLSLCLVLIEGVRQNTVRLEAECMVDVGMDSVLAEYHREALKQYNLFMIDSSYGSTVPSYYNTEARLKTYVEKNLSFQEELGLLAGNGIFPGIYMDLLKMEVTNLKLRGVSLVTDNGGYNLQKQAIGAVQSDKGIGILENVLSWIRTIEEQHLLDNTLEEEKERLEQELNDLRSGQRQDGVWVKTEAESAAEEITQIRRKGILNWVIGDTREISSKAVVLQHYYSARRAEGETNKGNYVTDKRLTLYERLWFQEYLLQYTGSYGDEKEGGLLDYQIEYLLFGADSDTENLRKTAAAICGLREVANLAYLSASAEKRELISTVSTVLAAAIMVPEAAPVLEGLILIAWSCLESLQDTKILFEGGEVPLLKDDTTWHCSLDNLFDRSQGKSESQEGLTYRDYLRIYMYFTNLEKITYRFMDVMEMDIRKTKGNEDFRIDGCIDYLEAEVRVQSDFGYEYSIKHAKGYR